MEYFRTLQCVWFHSFSFSSWLSLKPAKATKKEPFCKQLMELKHLRSRLVNQKLVFACRSYQFCCLLLSCKKMTMYYTQTGPRRKENGTTPCCEFRHWKTGEFLLNLSETRFYQYIPNYLAAKYFPVDIPVPTTLQGRCFITYDPDGLNTFILPFTHSCLYCELNMFLFHSPNREFVFGPITGIIIPPFWNECVWVQIVSELRSPDHGCILIVAVNDLSEFFATAVF